MTTKYSQKCECISLKHLCVKLIDILHSLDYYIVNLVFKRLEKEKQYNNASKLNHEQEMKMLKNK